MSTQPSSPRAVRLERWILLCTALFMLGCVLCIAAHFSYQWMDGSWNAQVAVTFAQTGRYAVTYPTDEIFHVPITTGQTVLLPAALAFRLGGVTDFTAALVPVLYMCAALLTMLAVLYRFFGAAHTSPVCRAVLCSACALFCFFSFSLYGRYAYQLLGEGAALLFLLLACLFLAAYSQSRKRRDALACGAMLACALVTKTVAVCFLLVFALLMLLECLLTRRFPFSLLWALLAGFVAAFGVLESFKFIQLGCDAAAYVNWWKRTIYYSFHLSAGQGSHRARMLSRKPLGPADASCRSLRRARPLCAARAGAGRRRLSRRVAAFYLGRHVLAAPHSAARRLLSRLCRARAALVHPARVPARHAPAHRRSRAVRSAAPFAAAQRRDECRRLLPLRPVR